MFSVGLSCVADSFLCILSLFSYRLTCLDFWNMLTFYLFKKNQSVTPEVNAHESVSTVVLQMSHRLYWQRGDVGLRALTAIFDLRSTGGTTTAWKQTVLSCRLIWFSWWCDVALPKVLRVSCGIGETRGVWLILLEPGLLLCGDEGRWARVGRGGIVIGGYEKVVILWKILKNIHSFIRNAYFPWPFWRPLLCIAFRIFCAKTNLSFNYISTYFFKCSGK